MRCLCIQEEGCSRDDERLLAYSSVMIVYAVNAWLLLTDFRSEKMTISVPAVYCENEERTR